MTDDVRVPPGLLYYSFEYAMRDAEASADPPTTRTDVEAIFERQMCALGIQRSQLGDPSLSQLPHLLQGYVARAEARSDQH